MKGVYLLSLVLLIVLAIPLFADHTLVEPVGEFSAISIINSKEESETPDLYMTDQFLIEAIKPDEIVIPPLKEVESTFRLNSIQNTIGTGRTNIRGARRIKSGRY